jgi:hypothetical protein
MLTRTGSSLAVGAAVLAAVNLVRMRTPPAEPPPVAERVCVLLPVRDEAHRVGPCVRSLTTQTGVRDLEILVLDDSSSDGTADLVKAMTEDDHRVRVLTGGPLPNGWWGKPWACQQLADAATGSVLVFVDADVVLAPHAVASAVTLLRWTGLDLVSPYPRQVAGTVSERLVQPLLAWSILSFLPLRAAERSARPSLSAANGQFLVVDRAAYVRAGGHAAVRADLLEDIALLRSVKRAGGRGVAADGTMLASCRMYDGWPELRAGYAKSLWSAFGTPAGALAVAALLGVTYVVPPVAVLFGSRVGLAGYLAGVTGRAMVARRVGARVLPDVLTHPVSVGVSLWLLADSIRGRRRGQLIVKGRRLTVGPGR